MERLNQAIKEQKFQQLYVLYGTENFLVQQYKNRLVAALADSEDTMNFTKFEGDDIAIEEVAKLAETLPFFAPQRVILIQNSGWLKKANDKLIEVLEELISSTYIIFVEKEIDKRNKAYKLIEKKGMAVEMNLPNEKQLSMWVNGRLLKSAEKKLTVDGWEEFLNRCGGSMDMMEKEVQKLIAYVGDETTITKTHVEQVCIQQIETKLFVLLSCIAEKNVKRVMELYHDMLAAKEPPMKILFWIGKKFRDLVAMKELASQGMDVATISRKMKLSDYRVKNDLKLCRKFSKEEMLRLLQDVAEFEELFKTGKLNEQMAVELLMVRYSTNHA